MAENFGYIGLGAMGLPMAANLVRAGHRVMGLDTDPARMALAKAAGIGVARDVAQVVAESDIILACLPHTEDVEKVALGPGGLKEGDVRGKVFIDMSTTYPAKTAQIAAALAGAGMDMLDAPISGGPTRAEEGRLSIMVGGPSAAFARARGALEVMGNVVEHMGDAPGLGGHAKLCNQIGVYVNLASVAECMTYAAKMGLPQDKVFRLLANGVAGSMQLDIKAQKIIDRDWSSVGPMWMAHKDVGYVVKAMKEHGFELPFIAMMEPLLGQMRARGYEDEDQAAIVELFEEMAGITPGESAD